MRSSGLRSIYESSEMIMPVEAIVKQDCNAITPKSFTGAQINEIQENTTQMSPAKYVQRCFVFCWFCAVLRDDSRRQREYLVRIASNNNHDWLIHAYEKLEPNNYITGFIQHNVRPDGRTFCACRSVSILHSILVSRIKHLQPTQF
jgi:hypothetical protein